MPRHAAGGHTPKGGLLSSCVGQGGTNMLVGMSMVVFLFWVLEGLTNSLHPAPHRLLGKYHIAFRGCGPKFTRFRFFLGGCVDISVSFSMILPFQNPFRGKERVGFGIWVFQAALALPIIHEQ